MKAVAAKEYMDEKVLMDLVARGQVAIPANKKHSALNPEGVGRMLRTKINVNLGISRDCKDYNIEMQKVFEKSEETMWECRNCGHLVIGKKAPQVCPVCAHPQSFFEVRKENY